MTKILQNSGFLPSNGKVDPRTQGLIDDIWSLVQGEKKGGVTFDNLRVVLINIIGARVPDRETERDEFE